MVNPYPYGTGYRGADRTVEGLSDRILKSMGLDPQRPRSASNDNHDSSLSVHQTAGVQKATVVGPVRAKSTVESGSHLDKLKNRFGGAVTLTLCCATIVTLEGPMKISTSITGIDYQHLVDHLKTLESAGFSSVSTQENRLNPFLPLSIAAAGSQALELKTSVAIAFARSPMVTAQIAWELARASEGRFVLGLGSQVKSHIERRFSQPWSAPATRMREVIQAIRAIWHSWSTGDRLDFSSEHFSFNLMTPNFTPPDYRATRPLFISRP